MQGPLPGISEQMYDLPGVPWTMFFTKEGGAIHGAYWHDSFGMRYSHGCVNLPVAKAKTLYDWADAGTRVYVRN
jgi:lipoprotein-anchoring transpeptidase ErfK/SrfK